MTAAWRRRRVRPLALGWAALAIPLLSLPGGAAAESLTEIRDYVATVTVNSDGSLRVAEEMRVHADGPVDDGSLAHDFGRSLVIQEHYDAEDDRIYDVTEVSAEVDGMNVEPGVDLVDDELRWIVEVPTPSALVRWEYTVAGAVSLTADGVEVRWPVVQGFDRPIEGVRVEWNAPDVLWLSCLTGSPGSSRPCTTSQLAEGPSPTMTQRNVAAGDQVVGILGLSPDSGVAPNAVLKVRWSLARSFTSSGIELATALVLLGIGLLASILLWWTRGRDTSSTAVEFADPIQAVDDGTWVFAPPSAIRPGQMGTLVDERADVVDVAATIADLGVRNYLFVEEIERGTFGRMDWMLRKRNAPGDELLAYERTIFEAIFSEADEVLVSALPGLLRNSLGNVQGQMYADMVDQGWFAERPDAVRGRWTTAGWVLMACGVVMTVVLALVSTFGLAGLAVVIGGAALAAAGQVAPSRTARGSQVLRQLRSLREWLETAEVAELPIDQREQVLSRLYPYALVFGSGERWAQAIADIDDDLDPDEPLYWYGAPTDWHLSDIAPSLHNLTVSLNAALGSRRLLD